MALDLERTSGPEIEAGSGVPGTLSESPLKWFATGTWVTKEVRALGRPMHVSRQISLPAWDELAAEVARSYWSERGFVVSVGDGPSLRGARGSVLGTFFPYYWGRDRAGLLDVDWRKREGKLTMTPRSGRDVLVELDLALVTLPGRQTEWATAYLRLEVAEFHHIMWGEGGLSEVWQRFTAAEREATMRWLWTMGLAGRHVSYEWEEEISELEIRFLLAVEDRRKLE